MSKTFADFQLHESLQEALQTLGFTAPTTVQEQAIPAALEGKDLLVSSQTGSGKTAAFLLPTLNALATNEDTLLSFKDRMRAVTSPDILVLCPTRELAQQVSQDAITFVRHMKGVRIAAVMGGMPFGKQIQQLKGAQVVVATPGRLLDLVNRRQIKLDQVRSLIVDEADRMLDLGFSEDLEAISDLANNRKQTLMFSATFAGRIITLAERMMNDPVRIAIETGHSTNMDITQTLHWTDGFEHKKKLLTHWLSAEDVDQAVVFASTQEDTDMLAEELAEAGLSVVALHGAMPQTVRNRRLRSIREGRAKILVATDVAARGLDVPTISHVINFGLPMKNEDYVHRIGRTGRAGRTGKAITLATYRERGKIRSLEEFLEARLNVSEIEGLEPSPPPARGSRDGGGRDGGGRGRGGFGGGRGRDGGGRSGGGFSGGRDGGRGGDRPQRSFDDKPRGDRPQRSFDDKPRGERPAYGDDRPKRDFGDRPAPRREGGFGDRPAPARREGGFGDRPQRSFDDRPKRDFGDRPAPARREGGFADRPRSNDDNRGNRVDYKAPREGGFADRPKRDFGDRPAPRREGGFGDRPQRTFDDRPKRTFGTDERPKRTFGTDERPKRTFGTDERPKREFNSDRPRREGGEDRPRRKFND
ncbi:DEAD/DEAH box helicase [Acinetobacter sp. TGL-Y2]|uniref:DEAD/DEAH box helicase n=1 Tax=Acinetobacter sp. TGL-Y2 TaxID=1407071 RepID=UPI0007A662CF|nr:DEAD/DEAH box helicase [Acinetobacter sp. TGL-Y2]AMW79935.1 DEAD/DEAH box helicase [Acinetobacter sp. TGL-Y2]